MSFGIAKNVKSEVRVCTPELLNEEFDSSLVARTCAEIEDALEAYRRGDITSEEFETMKSKLKKILPILTPHATFENGRRKNDEAIPSGLSMYDLDHITNPRERWAEIAPRTEELGIVLAHITPSTEGLRLVFVMPDGMNLAEAQAWMAEQLGDAQYDVSVKDYARSSFLVPRDYVLYLNVEGLFAENEQNPLSFRTEQSVCGDVLLSEAKNLENINVNTNVDAHEILRRSAPLDDKGKDGPLDDKGKDGRLDDKGKQESYPTSYEEIPYELIIEILEEQLGGQPDVGSRNNFIFTMACHLRYICDDDPLWIAQVLPTYGEEKPKWMATIRSACQRIQTKAMPRIVKRTLNICKERSQEGGTQNAEQSNTPPPMPKKLPPLIRLLLSRTPKVYQPAVAFAVFPPLSTHLWKTTFRYVDNCLHEATLANLLMATTGSGKSCVNVPIDYIMADIRERDQLSMERERKWKQEINSKGSNKDKRQRPEGLVIQEIDPDSTSAAFVQRMADAEGRFLYARMNEIEQLTNLSNRGNKHSVFDLLCLAFDYGNVYGQTRVGTTSVSERVCVRFNYNVSTTIRKGQAFFRNVLTDGPLSRISICTIPEREIGAEMPVYGTYDEGFAEELKPYIERLNNARGLIECKQASQLAKKLMQENADFARLSQSRVFENLSFRANVIAFLKAMVLYVAHGEKWDKTMEEFVRWSLRYDLWCKMQFFGEAIENEETNGERIPRRGPQNLLDLLPEIFTREEAGLLRQRQGIRTGSVAIMLGNWKKRGYIELYGEEMGQQDKARQKYIKTEAYLKDHPQGLSQFVS